MAKKNVVKKVDLAANLAMYLLDKTGSVQGSIYGHGDEEVPCQVSLFGRKIYKGKAWFSMTVRGSIEEISITVGGKFGRGTNCLFRGSWTQCQAWLDAME